MENMAYINVDNSLSSNDICLYNLEVKLISLLNGIRYLLNILNKVNIFSLILLQLSFIIKWSSLVNISSCLNLLSHNTVAMLTISNMNISMPSSKRYHNSLYAKLMMINKKLQAKITNAVIQHIQVNGLLCFSASWIHNLSLPLLNTKYFVICTQQDAQ